MTTWVTGTPRRLAYAAVLAITVAVLAGLAAGTANASVASKKHHAIPVVILGSWKTYKHKHKAKPSVSAAPRGLSCPVQKYSEIDGSRYVFIWDKLTWFRSGPGGEVVGIVSKTTQINSEISKGASISIDALVEDSQVTISKSVTKVVSTTKGNEEIHGVPAGKYGNLEYGAWGYQVKWSEWQVYSNCTEKEIGHGTGMVPLVATGWHYWTN
jgi:hypothetical protein